VLARAYVERVFIDVYTEIVSHDKEGPWAKRYHHGHLEAYSAYLDGARVALEQVWGRLGGSPMDLSASAISLSALRSGDAGEAE
jgi:hypothetical protein